MPPKESTDATAATAAAAAATTKPNNNNKAINADLIGLAPDQLSARLREIHASTKPTIIRERYGFPYKRALLRARVPLLFSFLTAVYAVALVLIYPSNAALFSRRQYTIWHDVQEQRQRESDNAFNAQVYTAPSFVSADLVMMLVAVLCVARLVTALAEAVAAEAQRWEASLAAALQAESEKRAEGTAEAGNGNGNGNGGSGAPADAAASAEKKQGGGSGEEESEKKEKKSEAQAVPQATPGEEALRHLQSLERTYNDKIMSETIKRAARGVRLMRPRKVELFLPRGESLVAILTVVISVAVAAVAVSVHLHQPNHIRGFAGIFVLTLLIAAIVAAQVDDTLRAARAVAGVTSGAALAGLLALLSYSVVKL